MIETASSVTCPRCARTFQIRATGLDQLARCTCTHIFEVSSQRPSTCPRHPGAPATRTCGACAQPMCSLCTLPQADGSVLCHPCAPASSGVRPPIVAAAAAAPAAAAAAGTAACPQHAGVAAHGHCDRCGTGYCATCEFLFPGEIALCPRCAATSDTSISGGRKVLFGVSLALAGWGALAFVGLFFLAATLGIESDNDAEALGALMAGIGLVPVVIGAALGLSAIEKRLYNPVWLWIPTALNALVLLGWVLLTALGAAVG